jgi:hypothetical protein
VVQDLNAISIVAAILIIAFNTSKPRRLVLFAGAVKLIFESFVAACNVLKDTIFELLPSDGLEFNIQRHWIRVWSN